MKVCSVAKCPRKLNAHGMCQFHENRTRRGQPLDGDLYWWRFDQNVNKDDPAGCWTWVGYRLTTGYGGFGKQPKLVHRLNYERLVGPIPDGLQIDHLCRNRACVNPEHLEPVTARENVRRSDAPWAVAMRRGTCDRGHEIRVDNRYYRPDGASECMECVRYRTRGASA